MIIREQLERMLREVKRVAVRSTDRFSTGLRQGRVEALEEALAYVNGLGPSAAVGADLLSAARRVAQRWRDLLGKVYLESATREELEELIRSVDDHGAEGTVLSDRQLVDQVAARVAEDLDRPSPGQPGQLEQLRALFEDEGSWRGGYELTGEAAERMFRLLGLVPRCEPGFDQE